jgi:hypothetical protein
MNRMERMDQMERMDRIRMASSKTPRCLGAKQARAWLISSDVVRRNSAASGVRAQS